jgi:hypothetical protein
VQKVSRLFIIKGVIMQTKDRIFIACFLLFFTFSLFLPAEDIVLYDWSEAQTLYPGLEYSSIDVESPRLMKIKAVRVDLHQPGLSFHTTGRAENWGEAMPDFPERNIRTRRISTRRFLNSCRATKDKNSPLRNMVFAINAAPWSPWTSPYTHRFADNLGFAVADGILVAPANKRPSLIIYNDGKAAIKVVEKDIDISNIKAAVSGFAIILEDGVVRGDKTLHPRTAYGISKDNKYLIIMTVDGRQKNWSLGAGTYEMGEWLKRFGAWNGLNMDGGGSTSMACIMPGEDTAKLLNRPPGGGERSVGNNLGICIDPAASKK